VNALAATVVIPAYRAADTIAAVLLGLQGQDLAEPFEIVVVASGGDTTAAITRRMCPRATVVEVDTRLAPGAARNLGVAHARGDVVAFLAADCVPDPDWLRRRVEAHRAGHSLVGGFVDMATPTTLAGWAQYFSKFWGMLAYERRTMVGRGPLFHLSYARRVLDEFGPFLEAPIAGEDTAYNDRLVRAGHRVCFDGAIRVRHLNTPRLADVLAAQREQGAATGALCRDGSVARYYAPSVQGGWWRSLRTTWRAGVTVARYRPRWLARYLVVSPLVLSIIGTRRRAFRRALRDEMSAEGMVESTTPTTRVTTGDAVEPVRVSVVVPAFDEGVVLGDCLDSLLAQTCPGVEIVVADDGSRDDTVAVARRCGVPVLCLSHGGPARAKNAGARWARGDVIVFVDADLRLAPDCVERLAAPILTGAEVGTFTRDIGVANPDDRWGQCWSLRRGVAPSTYMPAGVPDRWANFRAVDRRAFLAAGGYDDAGYGEDMTLAPKLGALAVAVPGAHMWHHNPDSLGEVWENAVWFGRGTRVRQHAAPVRAHSPLRSLRRGLAGARRAHRVRYVWFSLVFDAGVLAGLAGARLAPERHWK
jgi:glycosyltransferase involved in cell wall biosynthesis